MKIKLLAALPVIGGLSVVLFRQPSVIVSQGSEPLRRIAALETRVSKLELAAMPKSIPSPTPTPLPPPGAVTDTLGIVYELEIDPDVEVTSWETHEDQDDYWSVAGTVTNNHATDRFDWINVHVIFFKGKRSIDEITLSTGNDWITPGESLSFDFSSKRMPKEFDHYTVEITVPTWEAMP